MVYLTTVFAASCLLAVSSVQGKKHNAAPAAPAAFQKVASKSSSTVKPRSLLERQTCSGTCSECFGSGYIQCPDSSIYCYLPGDSSFGLDSCPSSSGGSAGDSDFCSGKGATCVSCFGPGYLECGDGINCYDPNDPEYDTCPSDSTGSGSGSDSGTSSCAELHGEGNIPCGSDGCYNPDIGESCCAQGYYCDAGETCSSEVGECESDSSGVTSLLSTRTPTATGSGTFSTSNTFSGAADTGTNDTSSSGSSSSSSASGASGLGGVAWEFGAVLMGALGLVMLAQ